MTDLALNPDAHAGYGAPVGCVLTSPTYVYPGPVGVDIKCSMSFLQLDLPGDELNEKPVRRVLIDAILERTPTGPGRGQRSARKARKVGEELGFLVATEGASQSHGGFKGEGWVHRKGATRAFPAGHPALKQTPFVETGHPILLPGNPCAGSVIMVADEGAEKSAYSMNHGAGRCMGRKAADRALDQKTVDDEFVANDILTNCRLYGIALRHLGVSWRLGIDRETPGPLVTEGIYARSRHPIYVAFDLVFVGTFLVQGRVMFLALAAIMVPLLHSNMLREERFLAETYGEAYQKYSRRVRRYWVFREPNG